MKLYHLSQSVNNGYDTTSDIVVCAESEDEARNISPDGNWRNQENWGDWVSWAYTPDQVQVEYIGEAADHLKKGIICSSFHAG